MLKTVPINETAEAAALSLMATDAKCLLNLVWDAALFANFAHRSVFNALAMVAQRTGKTGALAVVSQLKNDGKLESCGGDRAVFDLLKTIYIAPGPVCVETADDYRKQLLKAKGYRDAIRAWEENEDDIRGMRANLADIAETFATAGEDRQSRVVGLKQHLSALIEDIERTVPLERFSTGIPACDRLLGGGMFRGEMTVVGAPTSGGKSILLYQSALQAAAEGKKVVVFSLEMPAKLILRRMASNMIGKPILNTADMARYPEEARGAFASEREVSIALHRLMKMAIIIRDDLSDVSEINAEIRRLANSGFADLAIVDYLQIVTMSKADNREQAVSELARLLKLAALNTNIAVMTASQLNDDGKLRESRAIGMHADNVVLIGSNESGSMLNIDKSRNNERGTFCSVVMKGNISRFEEVPYVGS